MKVMIDTNIIISAALNPQGTAAAAFIKALTPPNQPILCDYIVDELHRKFREKFPNRLTELEAFLFNVLQFIRIVPTPEDERSDEKKIRDVKGRPILRAALQANAAFLLTGDKDFLESGIKNPKIISAGAFLCL